MDFLPILPSAQKRLQLLKIYKKALPKLTSHVCNVLTYFNLIESI